MKNSKKAVIYILITYTVWGIQPLYWRLFTKIPLSYILAHRIIWAGFFMLLIVLLKGKQEILINTIKDKKHLKLLIISSIAIAFNWLANIYAAYTKQIVEASLGHYITPLVVILIGVFIFKEKVEIHKIISFILIMIGVFLLSIKVGKLPTIAISLIISFSIYTYIKKINPIDALIEVTLESLILSPFLIIYLFYNLVINGYNIFYTGNITDIVLLISTGIFTFLPLLLYSYGVKNINFTNLGFIQYWAPSVSLCIGIFIFKETFSTIHLISFSFIWVATLIVMLYPLLHNKYNRI